MRQGDEVAQGDTVITGANSSAVLKFDDGQVVALTANSRMTITAYQYNPATESGNVLLSLVTGGMRAITGLIGRRSPSQVAYRAATATIGIRGTDGTIATNGTDVVVTVTDGVMTFTDARDLDAHDLRRRSRLARPGQPPVRGPIRSVVRAVARPAACGRSIRALIGVVRSARPRAPRQEQATKVSKVSKGQQGQGQSGQQGGQPVAAAAATPAAAKLYR